MFDLKVIHSVLRELEEERGIPQVKVVEAIEEALGTAYKKEYGKRGQIVRAHFDLDTGEVTFEQVKIVKDESDLIMPDSDEDEMALEETETEIEGDERARYNPEQHILLADAQRIKKDAVVDEEIAFPLQDKEDYGRISAQTAKQVIIQKIREAEKISVHKEYGGKQGEIITGTVGRVERGNIFIDVGRANAILPYEEQIPGERFKQGEHIRGYLYSVEETSRGVFLRISRSKPEFLLKLFEIEAPEVRDGTVEIKAVAREAGSRSKIAVISHDEYIDPVGSLVGQRGVRVSTVTSELGGEKIDIIDYSENPSLFVEAALSPARINHVEINEEEQKAIVTVESDQQSLAIGKGGQNARLAAKLTGWKIDIQSEEGDEEVVATIEEAAETADTTDSPEETLDETTETPKEDGVIEANESTSDTTEAPEEKVVEEVSDDDNAEEEK